ncbi:MAG TPA: hypothetical protein VKI00_10525 [Mycobacterium sp.]|uniref:hypothetical protein n=1 Tax=Mycobacterium sp. TaxID=1785 RepID=UPI002C114818|nr:hypothetical protein [Mycobacterium sp.]HME76058.1 hypothetical protein [Mycobacterium sp.]
MTTTRSPRSSGSADQAEVRLLVTGHGEHYLAQDRRAAGRRRHRPDAADQLVTHPWDAPRGRAFRRATPTTSRCGDTECGGKGGSVTDDHLLDDGFPFVAW